MTSISQPDETPSGLTYARGSSICLAASIMNSGAPLPEDLRLDEMHRLLQALGNPHQELRIVHVAGSKGKGSVSAMLAAILHKAGYRAGLFTSPHLTLPEERVQIDGAPITPAELTSLVADIREAVGKARLQPTFFEAITALGFLHFQRQQVDVAVVEVGLGGRLDSTNVCLPEVAVVTSISFDHMSQLGNSLDRIAREKAGIFKNNRPAVSGVIDPASKRRHRGGCLRTGRSASSAQSRYVLSLRIGAPASRFANDRTARAGASFYLAASVALA